MSYFKNTGTIDELDAWLADVESILEKRKQVSAFEISRHCAHCEKEVRASGAENPNDKGEYNGVLCNRCYESEVEGQKRDTAYADYMNQKYAKHIKYMQDLRDVGVLVLEDYRED